MKIYFFLLAWLAMAGASTFRTTTILTGTVTDDHGEKLAGATVKVMKDDNVVRGTITDLDGRYRMTVDPDTYSVEVNYTGFQVTRTEGVVVLDGQLNKLDFSLGAALNLQEVAITAYKVPLVEKDKTESGQTMSLGRTSGSETRREAKKAKTTGKPANNQPAAKPAPYPSSSVNIKDRRASSTNYYIDGVRVSGGAAGTPPVQDASQLQVTPGGLGAEYGNITGGVIALKTKEAVAMDRKSINIAAPQEPVENETEALKRDSVIESNEEQYNAILENPYQETRSNSISTFSIDVDAASYANLRRYIDSGQMPPRDAVRIEEMVNYFDYQYPQPTGPHPFAVSTELAPCPWAPEHRLLLLGLQGQTMDVGQLPAANLVFLIDVSGSMGGEDKLGLVQQSLNLLTDQLRPNDRVAIVVYAGAAGTVLESTPGTDKLKIKEAINKLESGGSTAGGEGIKLAYNVARRNFVPSGNNRVILCTDGDFNVGVSSEAELIKLIEKERGSGVYLTVLGFGTGNYQDGKMQELADKGNGNHAYIDGLAEAKKVLVQEFGGTLFAIAKDVKLQLHFNPAQIAGYRLIGYENRMLATEDFHDDKKDAGELGAGHRVTALYELIPTGQSLPPLTRLDSALVVVTKPDTSVTLNAQDLFVLQLRYKQPKGEQPSRLMEYRLPATALGQNSESENLLLASTVAEFGLLLRNSKYKGVATYPQTLERARKAAKNDPGGYRKELVGLIEKAGKLAPATASSRR